MRIGPAPANVAESVVMHRAGDGFVAASATFHSSIDLQLVSYSNYIALECTIVCVRGTEQTDGRIAALPNDPYRRARAKTMTEYTGRN